MSAQDKKEEGPHVSILTKKDWRVGGTSGKLVTPKDMDPRTDVPNKFHSDNPFSVWYAVKNNHIARVKELIEKRGISLEHRDMNNGMTPLHWAAKFDRLDIIDFLVSKEADLDAIDLKGNTPFHYLAAFSSSPQYVLNFLRLDAVHTVLNKMGETPATMARRYGKDLHARIIDNWDPKIEELVIPDPDPDDVVAVDTSAARLQTHARAAGPDRMKDTMATTVLSGNVASTDVFASEGDDELTKLVRTLAIKRQRQGDMHRSLIPTLARVAKLFLGAGDRASARDCLEHRLKIAEKEAELEAGDLGAAVGAGEPPARGAAVHGRFQLELAHALTDLGRLLVDLAEIREAQALLTRAVSQLEAMHGTSSMKVTDAACLLARCQFERGMLASARALWRRSVEVMQPFYGDLHPDVAATWNHLGEAHLLSHQYEDAIDAFERAVACGQPLPDAMVSLNLATFYENLAKAHMEALNPSPAIETSLRHALEIRTALLGDDHEDVWQSRRNLGVAVCEVRHLSGLAAAGLNVVESAPADDAVDAGPSFDAGLQPSLSTLGAGSTEDAARPY